MTSRKEVEWIDFNENIETIYEKLRDSVHSRFIVSDMRIDKIKGVLTAKDFFEAYSRKKFELKDILSKPIYITENSLAFEILNIFKHKKQYIGIVVDETGSIKGVVTLHDLIEAIVGDLPDEDESDEISIFKRDDGSYLIDGKTLVYEINQYFQREIIKDNSAVYTTISGYILDQLKHIPGIGDKVSIKDYELEVMDMDELRIDKILMTKNK
jgi:putative hemolysin